MEDKTGKNLQEEQASLLDEFFGASVPKAPGSTPTAFLVDRFAAEQSSFPQVTIGFR